MRVVWSPRALREVVRTVEYLMDFNPVAAVRLAEGLVAAGNGLVRFPHRGRPVPQAGMRELVTAYPYVIRHRVIRDEVRIPRVRHTARQPTRP